MRRHRPFGLHSAAIAALTLLLSACSLAPDPSPPVVAAPTQFGEAEGWGSAQPSDSQPRGDWWQSFGDPILDRLEAQLQQDNPDLAAAAARYGAAQADAEIAGAGLLPHLGLGASALSERRSQSVRPAVNPAVTRDFDVSGSVSWELDFWGRQHNLAAAGQALAAASAADLASAELSLRASLATAYWNLRGADSAQTLLDATAEAEGKAYALLADRYKGGLTNLADLSAAKTQWQTARTQAADNHLHRAQWEHAIATLIGVAPADFHLDPAPLTASVVMPDSVLPSHLLERRPDVAAAERRVAAANASIGVARAAWFPQFDLVALAGLDSANAAHWVTAPSRVWALGPSMALPLFDNGARSGALAEAHADADAAAAGYRGTVLTAWREVEDALVAIHQLDREADSAAQAVSAAQIALEQAKLRYQGGIVTYLDVVTSQDIALTAQLASLSIALQRTNAHVALVRALGGGWPGLTP